MKNLLAKLLTFWKIFQVGTSGKVMLENRQQLLRQSVVEVKNLQETIRQAKIIGGTPARNNEFPFMARLIFCDQFNISCLLCGGSLIRPDYILTAAHCLEDKHTKIYVLYDQS